ncbi:hypothetical protein MKW98_020811 [Papaver atlanticum]|uniref:CASP-like protein n=1 Tax=Papaver atlanticum TaxID=357466 RepID=A0AAD4TF98_9MAGN|nr:hypothetical protein MKW98_020811 [Papaver atlanticum]
MESGAQPTTTTATSMLTMGLLKYGSFVLRSAAFVFSVNSFVIMASIKGFDIFHEFSYILAACVLSTAYTLFQNLRHINYLSTGNLLFEARTSSLVDFFGDQIIAYLLISSASGAAPSISTVNASEDYALENHVTSTKGATSTNMAFLAFLSLNLSAMLSSYKLSTKTTPKLI